MIQDVITCPYCGSKLEQIEEKYYCDFCVMTLTADLVQRNHERISVRVRDYVLDVYLDKTTPEIMRYSTFELLNLLKYARAERANIYKLMNTFYTARIEQKTNKFMEEEKYSREEYVKMTRKMFVVENLLRERLGYVPSRITNDFLNQFLENMKTDKKNPMIIGQQKNKCIKK